MTLQTNQLITMQTITPSYDPVEDRIRLCINYQDIQSRIDFMLTRSFLLQLLPTIEEYMYKYYTDETLEQESSQNSNENKSDKNISQTDVQDLELYKNREDLLYTVNLNYNKDTKLTTLQFISKNNITAAITCSRELLKTILESIKKSIPKVSWGIGNI